MDVRAQVANFTVKFHPIFLFLNVEINIHSTSLTKKIKFLLTQNF